MPGPSDWNVDKMEKVLKLESAKSEWDLGLLLCELGWNFQNAET